MKHVSILLLLFLAFCLTLPLACGGDDDDNDDAADDDDATPGDDDTVDDDDDTTPTDDDATPDDDDDTTPGDDDDDTGPDPLDDGTFTDDPEPFVSGLDARIDTYLADCAAHGLEHGSTHAQVCVLATDAGPVRDDGLDGALAKMAERRDCADFNLASLVRIMAKYADSPNLSQGQYDRIKDGVLNFSYWMDEPGTDAMNYQTENHSILFHSAAFVLGGLFPDEVFVNSGLTGAQLRAKAGHYINLWLDWRLRFGFTEFHSNVYYNETIPGLVNLADFAADRDFDIRAKMALDILLLDMAINNHEGVFGVAHGRTYMKDKQRLATEDTKATMWLMFGKGDTYGDNSSMSTVALADSAGYRMPAAIESIGAARPRGLVSRERISINVAAGPDYGIGYEEVDHGVFWWSMNGFVAPEAIGLTFDMLETWEMLQAPSPFAAFMLLKPLQELGILQNLMFKLYPLVAGNSIQQANTYVYRTPEVMLASAQDYHKGVLGSQVHLWQATLGHDALVFTTYPGGFVDDSFAGEWTGGWNPRVGQHRTAAIALYRKGQVEIGAVQTLVDLLLPKYTHAYFPRAAFDEIVESGHWTFGRYGDGYIALYSQQPTQWRQDGEWADKELFAEGAENVWICEVGDAALYGTFENFVELVSAAPVWVGAEQQVVFLSPGQGKMNYGWDEPLLVRGDEMPIADYPRIDSPYGSQEFDSGDPYAIERGGLSVHLDPATLTRTVVE
jgi:hypothetical protein